MIVDVLVCGESEYMAADPGQVLAVHPKPRPHSGFGKMERPPRFCRIGVMAPDYDWVARTVSLHVDLARLTTPERDDLFAGDLLIDWSRYTTLIVEG